MICIKSLSLNTQVLNFFEIMRHHDFNLEHFLTVQIFLKSIDLILVIAFHHFNRQNAPDCAICYVLVYKRRENVRWN